MVYPGLQAVHWPLLRQVAQFRSAQVSHLACKGQILKHRPELRWPAGPSGVPPQDAQTSQVAPELA